jgi:uracil-DNA glycosylase
LETPFKAPCPASDGRPWNDEIGQFLDSSIGEMEKISEPALDNNGASLEKAQEGSAQNVLNGRTQDGTVQEESSKTTPSPVEVLEKMLHLTNLSADLPPAKESDGMFLGLSYLC